MATAAPTITNVVVDRLDVSAYEIPTEEPESDATLEWDSVTVVLVEVHGGGEKGLGYTYNDVAGAKLVESKLKDIVEGCDAMSPPSAWTQMQAALRNAGRPGVGATAISAVDIALWDLKARLLGIPLADALPRYRAGVPVYGSGGFTSYSDARLHAQLSGWVEDGIPRVKMKVGREPDRDDDRLRIAREGVGDAELMVDANGAYTRKEALHWAERFAEHGVTWLEEPLSSEDLEGLRMLRDRGAAGVAIAAGEYGWDLPYYERMIGSVDIVQADVTRCGGITNMLRIDGLCKARSLAFSAHCVPAVSAHACCAMETLVHVEYFHDHYRAEELLFEGTRSPENGVLTPDPTRPGLGLELKRADAERFEV